MERLIIQNFGALLNIDIEIKDINIYVGPNSSGKSTAAKLISIFKTGSLSTTANPFELFKKALANNNIDFKIHSDTLIRYENKDLYYEIKGLNFSTNIQNNQVMRPLNPLYIPAERVFFTTLSQSVFSLMNSDVALPKWLIDFGAKFENARTNIKELAIEFLQAKYQWVDGTDYIKIGNHTTIKLSQASSGIQSIVPLLLVVQHNTNSDKKEDDIFVIEEPELNLYPSSQKDLVEFIVERINQSGDRLIITTHSPYLLTSIDNLIQAGNVVNEHPELKNEVEKCVPGSQWLNYDNVSCYYFNNGTANSTMDDELKSIGPSNIDDVSADLSETFESLLALRYS
jgi:predicted ATPase